MPTRFLPENPNLEHLRTQARTLQRLVRIGDPDALARIDRLEPDGARRSREAEPAFPLSAAQRVLAREYGFASWPRLRRYLDVVNEHGWSLAPPAGAEAPADTFCRLACLTYTAEDGPARWGEARARLAATPDLTRGHLWAAAAAGQPSTVEAILRTGGDARQRGGPYGWRPLAYLAYSRLAAPRADVLAVARRLLDAGADPNEGYLWNGLPYPFTLLTGVFGEGEQGPRRQPRHPYSLELARLLLEAGAEPNDPQTLYNRMFTGGNDHLELLFEYGLGRGDGGVWRARVGEPIPAPPELLAAQLRWAAEHDQLDRVRLLLRHGVDVHTPYDDGRTPWEVARLVGATAIADQLAAHGAATGSLDPVAEFVAAAVRTDRAEVDRLRAADPAVVARAIAARPGLVVWAAGRRRADTVALLLDLGFDVNARGRADQPFEQEWETALHVAAHHGDLALARTLLDRGADPRLTDARFQATPLGWARHGGNGDLIALLEPLTEEPSTVD